MDRRKFIKQTALFSLSGILLPSFLTSCRKETLYEDITYDGKVIIIGAGAAGLYAGYILKSKGIDFQILEASSTYGGRMGTLNGFADYPLDRGAQWLHGKNSILGDLVTKTQTEITHDQSEIRYWLNNQIVADLPAGDLLEMFETEDLPDVSFAEYAVQQGFGSEYDNIVEAIAGDFGASADNISAYWNYFEGENWISGDDDFKFKISFFDLLEQNVVPGIIGNILLNTPVSKIDYSGNGVVVTDVNNTTYSADKVIITVPITILKQNLIQFVPALPSEKTLAFSKIGMEAGMKVFLKFSAKFYDQNIIGGAICGAYADESVGKTGSDNILLAFVMGNQAASLSALGTDNAIINALLGELDTMFAGQASANYIAGHVENWTTHPYIQGAYSYSTIGMNDARTVASNPVDDKLFFGGEAMNINGDHQSVHGAVETGYREVIRILESIQR